MGRNRIYIRAEKFGLLALIPLYFIVVGDTGFPGWWSISWEGPW